MPKSIDYRTSACQFDGALPLVVNSPELTLHTAQADQGKFVAPCSGTIVAAVAKLVEVPGTAAGVLNIGADGDVDAYGTHSFATTDAVGVYDLLADLTGVKGTTVTKGEVIEFGTDGGSTTTGLVAVTLVISPNA